MIQKKILEEAVSRIKDEAPVVSPQNNKAKNLVIRAKQCLDAGKLEEAGEYINRALDEDATLFEAWELMFFYKLKQWERDKEGDIINRTFRIFTAFDYKNREEACKLGY